jgi:hypothetical protein
MKKRFVAASLVLVIELIFHRLCRRVQKRRGHGKIASGSLRPVGRLEVKISLWTLSNRFGFWAAENFP